MGHIKGQNKTRLLNRVLRTKIRQILRSKSDILQISDSREDRADTKVESCCVEIGNQQWYSKST